MNKQQRKELSKIIPNLESIFETLNDMAEVETAKVDNIPEGLTDTERNQKLSEDCDKLTDAANDLQSIIDNLNEVI